MPANLTYEDYVSNSAHMAEYREYQKRYATKMRESDRVFIETLKPLVAGKEGARLLDIGCSTGNLLMHLKHQIPGLVLTGADLERDIIAENGKNPDLAGIDFRVVDLVKFEDTAAYDVISCNAILFALDEAQFATALRNIARALRPGGTLVAFDLFFAFNQRLEIVEFSKGIPNGLRIAMRSQDAVHTDLRTAGFSSAEFRPFYMPFDLPRSVDEGEMTTYTVPDAAGNRMSFRGALHQPWCHLTARVP